MANHEYKIIFTGSIGVGKTTAIAAISEIPPVTTEVQNTDREAHSKETTTTAMDYGEVTLAGGDKLRLYGTPGQARFNFMWKILSQGALGVVILVDASRASPSQDLRVYLDAFKETIRGAACVIGVGRSDQSSDRGHPAFQAVVDELDLSIPIFSVDVRERSDVHLLLDVLFHQLEAADTFRAARVLDPEIQ